MRKNWFCLIVAAACGCSIFPHAKPLPAANVRRLALPPIANRTQQPGLEDQLLVSVRDELLRDGRCPLVPEPQAEAVVRITLTRYLNIPIQYDSHQLPTAYKMSIHADVELVDAKKQDQVLWVQRDLEEVTTYSASNLAGGLTEAQAQADIWDSMSRDIVQKIMDSLASAPPAAPAGVSGQAPGTLVR